jgi:hypothetical protein
MATSELEQRIAAATAVFAKDEGTWDAEMTIVPGPGMAPIQQKGVSTNRRIAGGRWLVVDFRAESGFEGHGVYGWDAARERYTGAWVDSLQTAIARGEGTWDPAARTMTFEVEVAHAGQMVRYREVTKTLPDGSLEYRHFLPTPGGGEFEMIRTVYRRRAG